MKMTDVLSVLHGKMLKTVEKEKKCRVSLLVLSEWEAHGKNIWVFCSYAVFSSIIMYNFLKKMKSETGMEYVKQSFYIPNKSQKGYWKPHKKGLI